MREHWLLPDEEQFSYSGPDWFLLLLDRCTIAQRDLVKLVLWKAWTIHNNIIHQSGHTGILERVHALLSMKSSLELINEGALLYLRGGRRIAICLQEGIRGKVCQSIRTRIDGSHHHLDGAKSMWMDPL